MAENKENKNNKKDEEESIDLILVIKTLWDYRKKYFKILPIVFVIASIYIVSKPRYYDSSVVLVPESQSALGSMSALAAMVGVNVSSGGKDAITSDLYPDVIASTKYIAELCKVHVTTLEGDISTDYYDYLQNYQKRPWWGYIGKAIHDAIGSLIMGMEPDTLGNNIDPFMLSMDQEMIIRQIAEELIMCDIDLKTDLITITVRDQDPLVSATLADSACVLLQKFIIDYRTNKARIDLDFNQKVYEDAKADYEAVRREYIAFCDANINVTLPSVAAKKEDYEKEMTIRYNIYSSLTVQLQSAQQKLQEETPAFSTLEDATVAIKPTGPRRTIFVLGMLILAGIAISGWVIYKENDKLHFF